MGKVDANVEPQLSTHDLCVAVFFTDSVWRFIFCFDVCRPQSFDSKMERNFQLFSDALYTMSRFHDILLGVLHKIETQ